MRLPPHSPVLARPGAQGGIDIQVGLASPVVLEGLGLDERTFVASLEGGRAVPPVQARRFPRVIAQLTNAGAWAQPSPPVTASVAVHGCGGLGMEIAGVLTSAGFAVAMHDDARVAVEPAGTYAASADGTCAGAAAATLSERGATVRVGGGGESVVVIVCTGAPDPALVSACVLTDVPHALVVCDGAGVWVSHLMVPGASACARCRDIVLTRADTAWPAVSLQLGGCQLATRRPAAPRIALPTAAARVTARVAGWVERADVGVAEHIAADGELIQVPLEPQPECGCGASGPVGDDVAAQRARWRR